MVSREDIARRLWAADVFIDLDAGIRSAILKIRQALGDARELPRFVETVAGKGYRLVAPVEVVQRCVPQVSPALAALTQAGATGWTLLHFPAVQSLIACDVDVRKATAAAATPEQMIECILACT